MNEYNSSSRLIDEYIPMSPKRRKELIDQLNLDMANHPGSERSFKEIKCKEIGVDLRTLNRWFRGENIGLKSLSRIEIGLSENYTACSLMYSKDSIEIRNFLQKMSHYIIEASWLGDLDENTRTKIGNCLNELEDIIKDIHSDGNQEELMDLISKTTDDKNALTKFIDDSEKGGITLFMTYIPRYMYPKGVKDSDQVGLICINAIPIENLKKRPELQPSDLIFEPSWKRKKPVKS